MFFFTEEITVIEDEPGPSSSVNAASSETQPIAHIDDSDSEVDLEAEKEPMPQEIVLSPPLTLAGLSRAKPGAHSRRSDRYFWSALTVAVVYALPVVQLLSTYQRMVFQTGNQDLCYYNFLCAHPLGFLSDFNHVYSNVGYVLLGLVFMVQTWWRQIRAANHPKCLILKRAWVSLRTHGRRTFLPSYTARALLLAVANIANWALAAYGMYSHNKDFARHLLAILMGNAILYMLSYVLMKLVHRELIPAYVWVQLALAHAAWVLALLLFLDSRTKWSVSSNITNQLVYCKYKLIRINRNPQSLSTHFIFGH
ncbi:SID1 transmembrane family member 1 [Papilio machaon]|uniref:SID1 transmembrane family member 1 n=1 Tax=Papilio machaon TaxID=76193 RepID=A0A0N1ICR9_PAPMA|nr:SID1 transmembrane family member 1 [Papilio machaon]